MEVRQCHIQYEHRGDRFRIWGIGDIHLLSKECAEKELRETIKEIEEDPMSRWFGMGDFGDYINWTDAQRFDPQGYADWVALKDLANVHEVCIKALGKVFDPIADKCLGIMDGNHETEYERRHSVTITTLLAERLRTQYLGYSTAFRVIFLRGDGGGRATSLPFYLFHGAGGGALKGGKALKLARYFGSYPWARVIFSAHQHDVVAVREDATQITWPLDDTKSGRFRECKRIALMVGGFRRTLAQPGEKASYSERKGHPVVAPAAVWVEYHPDGDELYGVI